MATATKENKNALVKEIPLKEFLWTAKNDKGTIVKGEMESASENVVRMQLRSRGLTPVMVKAKPRSLLGERRVKEADLVVMVRQLSTMINAGVPVVQSFELLVTSTGNRGMKKLLLGVTKYLKDGESVAQSMAHYPKYFDRLFIALIAAGEQGGILDTILLRLAEYREKTMAINKKIKSAMFYPAAIITVMIVVVAILMIFVIPVFSQLFSSFGATLPLLTRVVIDISNWMRSHWYIVVFTPVLAVWAFVWTYKRNLPFRTQVDRISLKLPILGPVLLKGAVARFMRTLSTMQSAGVPIAEALETLSKVSNNVIIEHSVLHAQKDVMQGGRITDALKEDGVFPIMATQMLSIGEETGAIEIMSGKVADFYEAEVNETVGRMSTLMEPIIMVILGVIVGTLVVAMYMPIFMMGAVVTHGG